MEEETREATPRIDTVTTLGDTGIAVEEGVNEIESRIPGLVDNSLSYLRAAGSMAVTP